MELIVDASVVFSFFKPGSFTRDMIKSLVAKDVKLVIPQYGINELLKLEDRICRFCGISSGEFMISLAYLIEVLHVVPESEYKSFIPEGKKMLPGHPEDAPYFALALKLGIPIWSNENRFKGQDRVKVFRTDELK